MSYPDVWALQMQRNLDVSPMKYKFNFSDIILFYNIFDFTKLNDFENTLFVSTLNKGNDVPLSVREIDNFDQFSLALKDHLWRILV